MARERDPRRAEAEKLWLESKGKIGLNEIAQQLDLPDATIRGWKNKDGWASKLNGGDSGSAKGKTKKKKQQSKGTEQPKKESERSVKRSERSDRIRNVPNDEEPIEEEDPEIEGLTDKNRLFVMEYLRDFNATRAAMNVGYSKKTASSIGWRLLRKVEIQTEIARVTEMMAAGIGLSVQRIIAEWMKIAFADITDYARFGQEEYPLYHRSGRPVLDEDGKQKYGTRNYVDLVNYDEIDGAVISEVKEGKDGFSVKLYNKTEALKQLEKYAGFLTEMDRLKIEKAKLEVQRLEGGGDADDEFIEDWVSGVTGDDNGDAAE